MGLEAHDGSGKSTTAVEISKLFNGSVFFTNEDIKSKRSGVYKDKNLSHAEKMSFIEETYETEKVEFLKKIESDFVVLDRTWYSHIVEENVMDILDRKAKRTYPTNNIPSGILKPDFVFQIIIPEEERQKRVEERGEDLAVRDIRLNKDHLYREMLENEREQFGCSKLRLRLRDPKVCALRAAQVLLGNASIPPLKINLE
ncbi:hypothetical protein OAV29_00150 [Candidatus Poseidoniaceae archaeon]|nr:hypothetical protein [Candidatus Poseidoniaceae archaeon]